MARPQSNTPAPTETGTAKSANKERVRFIFEPDRHSPNGITFTWLIHKAYGGKEKAATATRAFWLPFAYQETGNYSEAELKEVAQQSIWRLEEQIQHLRETFGLETPRQIPKIAALQPIAAETGAASTDVPATEALQPNAGEPLNLAAPDDLLSEFSQVI